MGKLQKNESGFSVVEIVMVIVILGLIGTVGWLVYKNHHKTPTPVATTSTTKPSTTTKTSTTTTTPSPYAGWQTYTLPVEKLSFKYPSNWTVSNTAPTSTQDNTTLTSSDGFTFSIEDGVSNGGDAILEAPTSSAVPVTFNGQSDYLVFTYGTGSRGQGTSDGMIAGAVLQTSTNEQGGPNGEYPWVTDKYAVGPNDTTGAVNATYMLVSASFKPQLTLQQAPSNADLKNAELVISSMTY